jgi:uncharacterized lipoprotein YajG
VHWSKIICEVRSIDGKKKMQDILISIRGELMVRTILLILFAVLLLGACSPASTAQPVAENTGKPLVTVYRDPT